ncbi:MAG: marine proteobacterial sortase target protein [Xanthomonadales bacterium]|nr:marine proteobacterial sortase target protein [Xanthomonadales bacterium]
MSKPTYATINSNRSRSGSIRDELEKQAWIQNPGLAQRLNKRQTHENQRNTSWFQSARRIKRWQDRVLLTVIAILLVLFVIRTETAIADEPVWGLEMKSDAGVFTELAVNTSIQLDITGLVARVEITQQFSNHGSHWAEGIYRFPLPEDATVDRMRIKVGERLLEGEIQEKKSARQTYEKARKSGQTATIVEQQRRNQFETRLANIGPGEVIEITIGYLQNVSYSDFTYSLRLPMTFTPRWEPGRLSTQEPARVTSPIPLLVPAGSGTGHRLKLHARLTSSAQFAAIESRYHDVDIRQVDDGYTVELLNPDAVSDRDFELSWTPSLQSRPSASLTTFNDGESVYAQLMLAPPLADSITPQAREVVLVIDTSGSMEGASLPQAKAALQHALESLGSDDYFNLLQFNSDTELLFEESVPVTKSSLYVAQNFITGLHANGGTDMAPALRAALSLPEIPQLMRQVVFITDGAVGNETELLQRVAGDLGDSRMFTVAIGHAPNSWFMRKAAEIGRGSYVHIGKPDEVAQQMSALWGRIQLPALTDICVEWGDSAEYYPEIIPDLYAGEPLWLLARLPSDPTMIGLCGDLNGVDWNLNVNGWDAASSGPGEDNLAKLWARKKIESLEDSLMFGADPELTRLSITGLALDYGLLTRHTSLVAVDKTPRRKHGEPTAMSDIPGLLPAGNPARLAGYPNTATGWFAQLLLSVFVLLLATAMLLFSSSHLPMTKRVSD